MIRQHRGDRPESDDWLDDGDVPADPMADFANTNENRLSIWLVDDEKTNLKQIVVAMAANDEKGTFYFSRAFLDRPQGKRTKTICQ